MIRKIDHWSLNRVLPTFNDTESLSVLDLTSKNTTKINEIIDSVNGFIDEINTSISEFTSESNTNIDIFKVGINQKLKDFIDTINLKIDSQDEIINSNVITIKNDVSEYIENNLTNILNDLIVSGALDDQISSGLGTFNTSLNTLSLRIGNNEELNDDIGTVEGETCCLVDALNNENTARKSAINTLSANILSKDNTTEFTPTGDYTPATKKYVDEKYSFDSQPTEGSINPVTSGGIYLAIQNASSGLGVTVDSVPTAGSNNPVTSGGVKTSLDNLDIREYDTVPTTGSTNNITSGSVKTAIDNLDIREYDTVPTTSSTNNITSGSVKTAIDNLDIREYDTVPTTDSTNNVTSNGIKSAIDTAKNYNLISNKPKINSVELSGNKSFNDLGIFDSIYPVGSIYMNVNNTNPTTLFGGVWQQIKDTFLLACGDIYANNTTGGESTHTLTVDELPSHRHQESWAGNDGTTNPLVTNSTGGSASSNNIFGTGQGVRYNSQSAWMNSGGYKIGTFPTGNDLPHNNMPPYLTVYVWKRTA